MRRRKAGEPPAEPIDPVREIAVRLAPQLWAVRFPKAYRQKAVSSGSDFAALRAAQSKRVRRRVRNLELVASGKARTSRSVRPSGRVLVATPADREALGL